MSTELTETGVSADVLGDLEQVLRQSEHGVVRDSELVKRITERSERVQDALRRKYGQVNLATDFLREVRDEA